jgi:hypothetical protein
LTVQTAASVTDWIGAVSAAVIGLLGIVITIWQWRASGFRPTVSAVVDQPGEAMEIRIVNRGRAAGVIERVVPIEAEQVELEKVEFEGYADGSFEPTYLPGLGSMRVILKAPASRNFADGDLVKVEWGPRSSTLRPDRVKVHLYGLRSVLPPDATRSGS